MAMSIKEKNRGKVLCSTYACGKYTANKGGKCAGCLARVLPVQSFARAVRRA